MEQTNHVQKPRVYISRELMDAIKQRARENRRTITAETEYLIEMGFLMVGMENNRERMK